MKVYIKTRCKIDSSSISLKIKISKVGYAQGSLYYYKKVNSGISRFQIEEFIHSTLSRNISEFINNFNYARDCMDYPINYIDLDTCDCFANMGLNLKNRIQKKVPGIRISVL